VLGGDEDMSIECRREEEREREKVERETETEGERERDREGDREKRKKVRMRLIFVAVCTFVTEQTGRDEQLYNRRTLPLLCADNSHY
jgi:hypothetical protein